MISMIPLQNHYTPTPPWGEASPFSPSPLWEEGRGEGPATKKRLNCGDTPTLTLPRKRERGYTDIQEFFHV